MIDWMANETLFRSEWEAGVGYEDMVATIFRDCGLRVYQPKREFRGDVQEAKDGRFSNQMDLVVGVFRPVRVEVKSRKLEFTDAASFPYDSVFVDTVQSWNARRPQPVAIVLVSTITKAMTVIPYSSKPHWKEVRRHDRIRSIEDDFYQCDREHLVSITALVEFLRNR